MAEGDQVQDMTGRVHTVQHVWFDGEKEWAFTDEAGELVPVSEVEESAEQPSLWERLKRFFNE